MSLMFSAGFWSSAAGDYPGVTRQSFAFQRTFHGLARSGNAARAHLGLIGAATCPPPTGWTGHSLRQADWAASFRCSDWYGLLDSTQISAARRGAGHLGLAPTRSGRL